MHDVNLLKIFTLHVFSLFFLKCIVRTVFLIQSGKIAVGPPIFFGMKHFFQILVNSHAMLHPQQKAYSSWRRVRFCLRIKIFHTTVARLLYLAKRATCWQLASSELLSRNQA
jgi:hypothetical protein